MSLQPQSPSQSDSGQDRQPPTKHQRIGFFGPQGAGKTTVATIVAARLTERTNVEVTGEAAGFVSRSGGSTPNVGPLGVHWTVVDYPAGVAPLETAADALDTAFLVVTPETPDRAAVYERVADRLDVELYLVVNRFKECDRDGLRSVDGPDLAEYFYEDETVGAAMSDGEVPTLGEWTTETILLESLQPDRLDLPDAMAALEREDRSIVNVEVENDASALAAIRSFRENGYAADFFGCNCRCHDGHVLAREEKPERETPQIDSHTTTN
jgi:hypothetical protein